MSTVNHTNMRGLSLAEQSRMIVFRRELTHSKSFVRRVTPAQEGIENPPTGRRTPGKTIVQNLGHVLDVVRRKLLRNCPHKSSQFSSARHNGCLRRLSALNQVPVLPAQPLFSFLGNQYHFTRSALSTFGHWLAVRVWPSVMPRGFDQYSSDMTVARLGNASSKDPLSGRIFPAHQSRESHESRRLFEPSEVLNLGNQGHRAQRVHSFQTAKITHRGSVRLLLCQYFNSLIHRAQAGFRFAQRLAIGFQRHLQRRQLKGLGVQPFPVVHTPGFGFTIRPSLPEQELHQSVPGTQPVDHHIFPTAYQIPYRFFFSRRNMNHRQFSRSKQSRQLLGIPSIRLHTVAWPDRGHSRRDHRAWPAHLRDLPMHRISAGTRLITKMGRPFGRYALHQFSNLRRLVGNTPVLQSCPFAGLQDGDRDRILMDIKSYNSLKGMHGVILLGRKCRSIINDVILSLSYARLRPRHAN
jgi:hypothetical protein